MRLKDFSDIRGNNMAADPSYTESAFIAHLKEEEGVTFVDNPHIRYSKSGSRNLKNFSADRIFSEFQIFFVANKKQLQCQLDRKVK